MTKPRVFISSTYYDLKHIRASLKNFIESLGYDAISSEKGDIAYDPDKPLDESCYQEVRNADIFVLLIGGRYGSEKSESKTPAPKGFFEQYDSITKMEFKSAVEKDIPIYILIDRHVHSEYQTYRRNKDNKDLEYAFVDSVNVFVLIDEILGMQRNNPVQPFDRFSDIQEWLREQWAGRYRDMLNRRSSQKQLASLSAQVETLTEISKSLNTFLERFAEKVLPEESKSIIDEQKERMKGIEARQGMLENALGRHLVEYYFLSPVLVEDIVRNSSSVEDFVQSVDRAVRSKHAPSHLVAEWGFIRKSPSETLRIEFNSMRLGSACHLWTDSGMTFCAMSCSR